MSWKLVYTKQAQKDAEKLAAAGLKPKAQSLLAILAENPYRTPHPLRTRRDLAGACSRRTSIQHRLVYQVLDDAGTVKVLRMCCECGRAINGSAERIGQRAEGAAQAAPARASVD